MYLIMNRNDGTFLRFTNKISMGALWVKSRNSAFRCDNHTLAFSIAQCHNADVIQEI